MILISRWESEDSEKEIILYNHRMGKYKGYNKKTNFCLFTKHNTNSPNTNYSSIFCPTQTNSSYFKTQYALLMNYIQVMII